MLEYDSFDVPEEIYVNKTNGLHECVIFNYWYLFEINSRFQPKVCNIVIIYCKKP